MHVTLLGAAMLVGIAWPGAPTVWHNDYRAAVAEACSSDKPLFIVICPGPSEYGRMATLGVFLSEEVERRLETDYVRFMVDTDTPAGREVATQFDVGDGPYFIIIDRSGKWQVYYRAGHLLEQDLTPVLVQYRRVKLAANGKPIREVATRPPVQVCST